MLLTHTYSRILLLLAVLLCGIAVAVGSPEHHESDRNGQHPIDFEQQASTPNPHTIPALLDALDVLEREYFELWQGIWPRSIDWTSAVIATYVAAALRTLSTSFASLSSAKYGENIINKYFSQLVASYFGQNAFALRQEAYDDMLWVVLGWLEGIKFINTHVETHAKSLEERNTTAWHGTQWIPAFAHRARLFWELASQGWDTSLCDGGMIWSPYLTPYKNAITNELWIAASISMYLYFPGDTNSSPFGFATSGLEGYSSTLKSAMGQISGPKDPKYLNAAVKAYKWLVFSNMTDSKGLYVDGYHVSGWSRDRNKGHPNTRCDERNEMVYTYNQGVLLTGQRGLYEATGARSYLEDGHKLISNVITATGWDLKNNRASEPSENQLGKWHGLGRSGYLEEFCDADAYCSQDSQTFKGIFFHHLTSFCRVLPSDLNLPASATEPGKLELRSGQDLKNDQKWHAENCKRYGSWIKHNARGALQTKDSNGKFGMWWGAPAAPSTDHEESPIIDMVLPAEAVDYRNEGVPGEWRTQGRDKRRIRKAKEVRKAGDGDVGSWDWNDRGRGRTVETQGGGVSVLRAMWELVDTEPDV